MALAASASARDLHLTSAQRKLCAAMAVAFVVAVVFFVYRALAN
jgi:hypothetical protein